MRGPSSVTRRRARSNRARPSTTAGRGYEAELDAERYLPAQADTVLTQICGSPCISHTSGGGIGGAPAEEPRWGKPHPSWRAASRPPEQQPEPNGRLAPSRVRTETNRGQHRRELESAWGATPKNFNLTSSTLRGFRPRLGPSLSFAIQSAGGCQSQGSCGRQATSQAVWTYERRR